MHPPRRPRANRYIVPGFAYHFTHRCHNREFLFKFTVDRQRYRIRLREALVESNVALLTYNLTHNHAPIYGSPGDCHSKAKVTDWIRADCRGPTTIKQKNERRI